MPGCASPGTKLTGRATILRGRDLFPAGCAMMANSVTLDGDFEVHAHDFLEVVVIAEGEGRHHCQAGASALVAGDVLVLRPGAWHAYRECRGLSVHNCCVGRAVLRRELAWLAAHPGLEGWAVGVRAGGAGSIGQELLRAHLSGRGLATCLDHLNELERGRQDALSTAAERIGHLLLVLGQVARALQAPAPQPRLHRAVASGFQLLDRQLAHPWTLAELAGRLHVEPSYLVRLFKAHTGLPPMAYLAERRARRAAELALGGDQPVAAIGHAVGWPDPSHFARRFRAAFGMSVSAYRRRHGAPHLQADRTHSG